jgi:hypothetical protein
MEDDLHVPDLGEVEFPVLEVEAALGEGETVVPSLPLEAGIARGLLPPAEARGLSGPRDNVST